MRKWFEGGFRKECDEENCFAQASSYYEGLKLCEHHYFERAEMIDRPVLARQ